jgi:HlyD family secretion protein
MFKKTITFALSVLAVFSVILVGATALRVMAPPALPPELAVREKIWPVEVQEVTIQDIAPTLHLFARVENSRLALLRSAVTADVIEVMVREGFSVSTGQVLVRLDQRDARLKLAQQEADMRKILAEIKIRRQQHETDQQCYAHEQAQLEISRRQFKREKKLFKQEMGSESTRDEAQSNMETSELAVLSREILITNHAALMEELEARLARTQAEKSLTLLELERCRIVSPFDGRITEIMVAPGMRVHPGESLVKVLDKKSVELRAQIPLSHLSRIRRLLAEKIALHAYAFVDDSKIEATLERLDADIPDNYGSVDGFFRVLSGRQVLELGRGIDLSLSLPEEKGVVALPFDAIYGTDRVYKLINGRMQQIKIKRVGNKALGNGETRVLVHTEELVDGDFVIVTQLPNAINGLKVEVTN